MCKKIKDDTKLEKMYLEYSKDSKDTNCAKKCIILVIYIIQEYVSTNYKKIYIITQIDIF